jgi:hypothetical protein
MQQVRVTPVNDVTTAEILWMRRKLHALEMVVDSSTTGIMCKGNSDQHIGHLASRRLNLKPKCHGKQKI